MNYASVCDGIGAAHVAWQPLGFRCAWTSEIAAFPSAVVEQRWGFHNLGDMLAADFLERAHDRGSIDLLVGGTPCQSFSVAGKRMGLDDPRGQLAMRYSELVGSLRPRWLVWENVPGVLSSGRGRDFGAFIGSLVKLGYGVCWRVLDAQYVRVESHARAVPKRRRRVFVVGHLGDWRRAAAVLLEREGMRWHPAPSRAAGSGVASALTRGLGTGGADDVKAQASHIVAGTIQANYADKWGLDNQHVDAGCPNFVVAHTLRGTGHDASEDGTGRGVPLVFDPNQVTSKLNRSNPKLGDPCHPLVAAAPPLVSFNRHKGGSTGSTLGVQEEHTNSLRADAKAPCAIATRSTVRRLTPRECERLQGFPYDYTAVQYRGKPAADGPRYQALGNSMAVNVIGWIGRKLLARGGEP